MSKLYYLYLIFPVIILVLFILSKEIKLPPQISDSGISRIFLKISLYIYKHLKRRTNLFSGEKVRMYLESLEHKKDVKNAETEYFIRKISIVLLMVTAGSILSFALGLSAENSSHVEENSFVSRKAYDEREYTADLVAKDEAGNTLGEYPFKVQVRQYTDQEAKELYEQMQPEFERTVLFENDSFDTVRSDLNLVEKIEGYPFDIRWKVDNYEVIHLDGRLIEDAIPEKGVVVMLTADISYRDNKWQQVLYANIIPKALNPMQRAFKEIQALLKLADENSVTETRINLPSEYDGKEIYWSERVSDNSIMLLALSFIGGAVAFVLKDKELRSAMQKRNEELLKDYPQFVSQLVLYMGAGMSMRNIFTKLAGNYSRDRKKGIEKKYLYEEILRTNRELMTGTSESTGYEQLGNRCQCREYTKLMTLMSQNLKKGNSELLGVLRQESAKAFEDRMDKVRKAGEEAGTKLLLPMIIMLVIVMIIIMIPAYLAF